MWAKTGATEAGGGGEVTYFHGGSAGEAPRGPRGEAGGTARSLEANHSSTEFLRRKDTRIPVRVRNAVAIKTLGYISRVRNIISQLSTPIT